MHKQASDVIEIVRLIRPGDLDERLLYVWLLTIETKVMFDVLEVKSIKDITYNDLTVPPPHDDLYWTYLVSMIDFTTGNFEAYVHSKALADKAWNDFVKHYHSKSVCTEPKRLGGDN